MVTEAEFKKLKIDVVDELHEVRKKFARVEVDLREIKSLLSALNRKVDVLIEDRETLTVMVLAERSLKGFLEAEPDVYSAKDIKVKYR